MQSFTGRIAHQLPSWLFQLLESHPAGGCLNRWWQWAAMSLGVLAGCSAMDKAREVVAVPLRITEGMLVRAKDGAEETWEHVRAPFAAQSCPCAESVIIEESCPSSSSGEIPPYQEPVPGESDFSMPIVPSDSETAPEPQRIAPEPQSGASHSAPAATATADLSAKAVKSPPTVTAPRPTMTSQNVPAGWVSKPTNAKPSGLPPNTLSLASASKKLPAIPAPSEVPAPSSASVSEAFSPPPAPAPATASAPEPLHVQTVSASRPLTPAESVPTNIKWCQVRLRNVSPQTVSQVSVVITSPDKTELVVSNAGPVLPMHSNRMDFSAIPQIAPQEEVLVTVGISAPNEQSHRLHVQVRDAQGGSHQEIQARWKVSIEPIDKPK